MVQLTFRARFNETSNGVALEARRDLLVRTHLLQNNANERMMSLIAHADVN